MDSSVDKQWATKYLLDPLTAPGPSEETGPGTHYHSTFSAANTDTSPPQYRSSEKSSRHSVSNGYPSPPTSSSPRQEQFPHRSKAAAINSEDETHPRSMAQAQQKASEAVGGRRRGSSLTSRFPGDQSHHPLDMLKQDAKLAHRAPHLRKRHLPGPDTIDSLDTIGGAYHHEGPFDATLLARNTHPFSPVQAVSASNMEALKATPHEKIKDSLERHRPLDGVAVVPPGMSDRSGRIYNYEEGADLMIEDGGNYKRWPGVKYLPEDLKGKGEPSYSIEKALKDHKNHRRVVSEGNSGIEMTSRPRSSDGNARSTSNEQSYSQWESDVRRSNSTGRKTSGLLKRRIGSLRRKKDTD